jgi:hypothetical protein
MCTPKIPDFNSAEYDDLIDNLTDGACVFFGAGVSKLSGYKLWSELKKEMIKRFWKKSKEKMLTDKFDYSLMKYLVSFEDEIQVMSYLYNIDKKVFVEEMTNVFHEDQKRATGTAYNSLNRLHNGKNIFVTTNIDMGFQKYLGLDDKSVAIVPHFINPPKRINYLHGRLDKYKTWIFTEAQYHDHYFGENPLCMNFIKYIFENYSVVFIGYGLRDNEILTGLRSCNKKRRHYWLESSYRYKEDYLKIRSTNLREVNIHLIPYLIDTDGEELLFTVLDRMYKVLVAK